MLPGYSLSVNSISIFLLQSKISQVFNLFSFTAEKKSV